MFLKKDKEQILRKNIENKNKKVKKEVTFSFCQCSGSE